MMANYLLIGSRDPFESNDVTRLYALAENLVKNGSKVTLFLVQNGVLSARESAQSAALSAVAGNGVEVLADEFSLRERGISPDRLVSGVAASPLDMVVDLLADGRKTIWS
jgi:sulfur relay (sulfurtransferase) complex TusBCD TusD component (DsrE family)